ncbi:HEPN domain-containing protein [Agarivorans litoreus]|uniref:HEPN domain-containing protein n=1 Tax=Agarivorans litoreus TaxID=1510455 RepID=UPI001C7D964E|nr:HEPN domain-containing protein [Agarivorans litoreus]
MPTFLQELIATTDTRWKEVELLIEEADKHDAGSDMYDSLCRSTSILMISHMEGFIKGLVKSLVDDLNRHLSFSEFPVPAKEAVAASYYSAAMSDEKDFRKFQASLIQTLEGVSDFEANVDAFLFGGNSNKNPKPDMVSQALRKFGVRDVFKNLHGSSYEDVFESPRAAKRRLSLLHRIVSRACDAFPYSASLTKSSGLITSNYQGQTVWHEFLNNINSHRHQIVHGNTFENTTTVRDLRSTIINVRLFQLLVVYVVCAQLSP